MHYFSGNSFTDIADSFVTMKIVSSKYFQI